MKMDHVPAEHLAACGVVLTAIVLVCLLVSLTRDFYRPWVTERARERLRRRREDDQWVSALQRWNREDREQR